MLLHDDVIYQILQWLPVISLLRFKLVCRTWCALIESNDFVKQHLHHHNYDPNLRDKNHSLIRMVQAEDPPFTQLISIDSVEEPKACVQLDCSELRGYFHCMVLNVVSCDGIVCVCFLNSGKEYCSIYLWNPATKQSRLLPHAPFLDKFPLSIGFGFDIKRNDHKVVCIGSSICAEKINFDVYSLKMNSWRRLTTVFQFDDIFAHPSMPFNKGTCFFWGYISENKGILCFDFSSEMFRFISLPPADWIGLDTSLHTSAVHTSVVRDEIACVLRMNDHRLELWVFNEYGTVNESWAKLYTIPNYFPGRRITMEAVSVDGKYIFFVIEDQMCRLNVVTKEKKYYMLKSRRGTFGESFVGFKESLVSVEEGSNAPVCINKDNGEQK